MNYLNPTNIMLVITLGGTVFAVYRSFAVPDIENAQAIAVITTRLDLLTKAVTNDLPHDVGAFREQMSNMNQNISNLNTEVVRLRTILEERLPRAV